MFGFNRHRKPADAITKLGPGESDWLYCSQAYSSIFVAGQAGSAKTTGVVAHLALGILSHPSRPAALVLCQKPDEAARWLGYANGVGRLSDVVHVTLNGKHSIDIVDHEVNTFGGSIESAQSMCGVVMDVGNRSGQRNSSDRYWDDSSQKQIGYSLTILNRAGQPCGLRQLMSFCQSLPRNTEQLHDPAWQQSSFAMKCLKAAVNAHPHDFALELAGDWFVQEWPALSDKTRSIIESVTLNFLTKMLTSKFADLLSGQTTFRPENAIRDAKIVIWDTPGSVYGPPAQMASVAIKLAFQRAAMRRDLSKPCRPLFLACDEAANFVIPENDAVFLSQSRQFKCISLNVVQNLPLIVTALGGNEVARNQANAWISNHALIIAAANSDPETNKFTSSMAGEERVTMYGGSSGGGQNYDMFDDWMGQSVSNVQASWSQQFRPILPPESWLGLAKGGRENGYKMEAYVFQSGRRFSNGRTWIKGTWKQHF